MENKFYRDPYTVNFELLLRSRGRFSRTTCRRCSPQASRPWRLYTPSGL